MSRLDDAIEMLRKAAGDRRWCLVVDECAPVTKKNLVVVHSPGDQANYVLEGLIRQGIRVLSDDTDEDDPADDTE